MPRRTLLLLCLATIVSFACYRRTHQSAYARYFSEIMEAVDRYYVEPVDNQKLFEGAIQGMVDQLDPFSGYIGRRDARQFQQMVLDQRFDGVGNRGGHRSENQTAPRVDADGRHAGLRSRHPGGRPDHGDRWPQARPASVCGN